MNSSTFFFLTIIVPFCISISQAAIAEDNSAEPEKIETTVVVGNANSAYVEITEDAEKLVKMAGSLGDPLGAITALPGVILPVGGGAPAVRGSSPEDNRYYVDGMPAGYIFHEFNTSIFDKNVVQDFQLFPAGFGAQYAQATGAVFDIRLRDPAHKAFTTTVDISMLRSGIFMETGIADNTAAYLSLRKGMLEYFVSEDDEPDEEGVRVISAPQDSDYLFKGTWEPDKSNVISLSLVGANDFVEAEFSDNNDFVEKNPDFSGIAKVELGFDGQTLNWIRSGTSSEFKVTVANYMDSEDIEWGDNYFVTLDQESQLIKAHLAKATSASNTLSFGLEYIKNHFDYAGRLILFVCTEFDADCQDGRRDLVELADQADVIESSIYLVDQWKPIPELLLELGIQYAGNDYTDDYFLNPRFSASWKLNNQIILTSSAGQYNQTPEMENSLPIIGNPNLKAQTADHYTLGVKTEINYLWSWSVEAWYKELQKLPLSLGEDEPDADQLYSNDVEGEVSGIDLMINRNLSNRWYGWLALSYANSERTNLRTNVTRDYTFDTPLVLNLVANYQFSEKWEGGLRFTLKSGEATTEIIAVTGNPEFPGRYLPVYGEPYAERLPDYSRLDLRLSRLTEFFGNDGSIYFDIRNALNTENVVSRDLDYETVNETGELYLKNSTDMGIFGSIGVNFTF